MENKKLFTRILIALIITALLVFSSIFLLPLRESLEGVIANVAFYTSMTMLFGGGGLFTILGIVLIVLTIKKKITGKLKAFLLLTGASASAFLVGTILHNLFYALTTIAWPQFFEILEVIFFFIAIPISPIGFLVGIIGSFILLKQKKD